MKTEGSVGQSIEFMTRNNYIVCKEFGAFLPAIGMNISKEIVYIRSESNPFSK